MKKKSLAFQRLNPTWFTEKQEKLQRDKKKAERKARQAKKKQKK